jgi:hypothetical protein
VGKSQDHLQQGCCQLEAFQVLQEGQHNKSRSAQVS